HVVVLDEEDAAAQGLALGQLKEVLDQLLSGLVGGVGLAGEQYLDRPPGVADEPAEPVEVGEQQPGLLVGREAPREADGQNFGVEHSLDRAELVRREAVARQLIAQPGAQKTTEALLLLEVGLPEIGVRFL